jgi:hypothetical protein
VNTSSRDIISPDQAHVVILDAPSAEQREQVHEAVKANAAAWWHHLPDVWIVLSDKDANDWRDLVREAATPKLNVLVLKLPPRRGFRWSYYNIPGGDWLSKNLTPWEGTSEPE